MKTITFLMAILVFGACHSAFLPTKNFKRTIPVDPRYSFEIEVDFDATVITVSVEVETPGFVGFGISPDGVMWGADIFVGGVNSDGTAYFSDYHGRPGELNEDEIINWDLLEATQNETHTALTFSRLFDTGDSINDVPIRDEDTFIIWSIGQTDRIVYHGPFRGAHPINILDPTSY